MKNKSQKFELGELVSWESQSNGSLTVKCGRIVHVVGVHQLPTRSYYKPSHYVKFDGMQRNHESYLVEVPHPGKGKPSIYHPLVSKLQKEKE